MRYLPVHRIAASWVEHPHSWATGERDLGSHPSNPQGADEEKEPWGQAPAAGPSPLRPGHPIGCSQPFPRAGLDGEQSAPCPPARACTPKRAFEVGTEHPAFRRCFAEPSGSSPTQSWVRVFFFQTGELICKDREMLMADINLKRPEDGHYPKCSNLVKSSLSLHLLPQPLLEIQLLARQYK